MNDPAYPAHTYDELRLALRAGVERLVRERARRRRRARLLAVVAAGLLSVSGIALAASSFIGSPAPESVRRDIAAVDAGMPVSLRMDPDVARARSVATTGASTLWLADLPGGGRCLELVTTCYPDVRAPGCLTGRPARPRRDQRDAPQ